MIHIEMLFWPPASLKMGGLKDVQSCASGKYIQLQNCIRVACPVLAARAPASELGPSENEAGEKATKTFSGVSASSEKAATQDGKQSQDEESKNINRNCNHTKKKLSIPDARRHTTPKPAVGHPKNAVPKSHLLLTLHKNTAPFPAVGKRVKVSVESFSLLPRDTRAIPGRDLGHSASSVQLGDTLCGTDNVMTSIIFLHKVTSLFTIHVLATCKLALKHHQMELSEDVMLSPTMFKIGAREPVPNSSSGRSEASKKSTQKYDKSLHAKHRENAHCIYKDFERSEIFSVPDPSRNAEQISAVGHRPKENTKCYLLFNMLKHTIPVPAVGRKVKCTAKSFSVLGMKIFKPIRKNGSAQRTLSNDNDYIVFLHKLSLYGLFASLKLSPQHCRTIYFMSKGPWSLCSPRATSGTEIRSRMQAFSGTRHPPAGTMKSQRRHIRATRPDMLSRRKDLPTGARERFKRICTLALKNLLHVSGLAHVVLGTSLRTVPSWKLPVY